MKAPLIATLSVIRAMTLAAALWLGAAGAEAAVVVDGAITGDGYGAPVAVQTVNTGFGDNDGVNKGSELDAAYARIEDGKLYLALTGNLEDNFNKLVLFFDSKSGGQNALDTDTFNGGVNPPVDPSPFPGDPSMFAKMNAFGQTTFDSGFAADYVLVLRHGFDNVSNRFDVDYAALGGAGSQYLGIFNPMMTTSGTTGVGANASPISVGFNNSNTSGVAAGTGVANPGDPEAVTTGIELALSLADLGNPAPGEDIKITAYITNSNHDYVSNQFLGGLPGPINNLGSDGFPLDPVYFPGVTYFNLNDFAGNQYFIVSVVPETSALLCLSAAGSLMLATTLIRRRVRKATIDAR